MEPKPIRPIPQTPTPVTANGKPLKYDLQRIGQKIVRDGRKEGFGRLREVTEKSLGPLFRGPGTRPGGPRIASRR